MDNKKRGNDADDPGPNSPSRALSAQNEEEPPCDAKRSRNKNAQSNGEPRPIASQKLSLSASRSVVNSDTESDFDVGLGQSDLDNITLMVDLLSFHASASSAPSTSAFIRAHRDKAWRFPVARASVVRFEYLPADSGSDAGVNEAAGRLFRQLQRDMGDELFPVPPFSFNHPASIEAASKFCSFGNVLVLHQEGLAPLNQTLADATDTNTSNVPASSPALLPSAEVVSSAVGYMTFVLVQKGDRALVLVTAMHFRRQGTCALRNASELMTMFYSGLAGYSIMQRHEFPNFECRVVFRVTEQLQKLDIVTPYRHDWEVQAKDAAEFTDLVVEGCNLWVREPITYGCSPLTLRTFRGKNDAPFGCATTLRNVQPGTEIENLHLYFARLPSIVTGAKRGFVALQNQELTLLEELRRDCPIRDAFLDPLFVLDLIRVAGLEAKLDAKSSNVNYLLDTKIGRSFTNIYGKDDKPDPSHSKDAYNRIKNDYTKKVEEAFREMSVIVQVFAKNFPKGFGDLVSLMTSDKFAEICITVRLSLEAGFANTLNSERYKRSWGQDSLSIPVSVATRAPQLFSGLDAASVKSHPRSSASSTSGGVFNFEISPNVPADLRKTKNWLKKRELNKLANPRKEMPDEVMDCLITMILYHCDLCGNFDVFAILNPLVQHFIEEKVVMSKLDLYLALREHVKFDMHSELVLIPYLEKHYADHPDGHWLLFAIDFKSNSIYCYDSCDQFKGVDTACAKLKTVFIGPLLCYKRECPSPVDKPAGKYARCYTDVLERAKEFGVVLIRMKTKQRDHFSCGFWVAKMILELMVNRCPPKTLNISLDLNTFRETLLRMMQTRDLYINGSYSAPQKRIECEEIKEGDINQATSSTQIDIPSSSVVALEFATTTHAPINQRSNINEVVSPLEQVKKTCPAATADISRASVIQASIPAQTEDVTMKEVLISSSVPLVPSLPFTSSPSVGGASSEISMMMMFMQQQQQSLMEQLKQQQQQQQQMAEQMHALLKQNQELKDREAAREQHYQQKLKEQIEDLKQQQQVQQQQQKQKELVESLGSHPILMMANGQIGKPSMRDSSLFDAENTEHQQIVNQEEQEKKQEFLEPLPRSVKLVGTKRPFTAGSIDQSPADEQENDARSDVDTQSHHSSSLSSVRGSICDEESQKYGQTSVFQGKKFFHCLICEEATKCRRLIEWRARFGHFERQHSVVMAYMENMVTICGTTDSCCSFNMPEAKNFWSNMTKQTAATVKAHNSIILEQFKANNEKSQIPITANLTGNFYSKKKALQSETSFAHLNQSSLQQLPEQKQAIPIQQPDVQVQIHSSRKVEDIPKSYNMQQESLNVNLDDSLENITVNDHHLTMESHTQRVFSEKIQSPPRQNKSLSVCKSQPVNSIIPPTNISITPGIDNMVNRFVTNSDLNNSVTSSLGGLKDAITAAQVIKELRFVCASDDEDLVKQEALIELFPLLCNFPNEVFKFFTVEGRVLAPIVLLLQRQAGTLTLQELGGLLLVSFLCCEESWTQIPATLSSIPMSDRTLLLNEFEVNYSCAFGVNGDVALQWVRAHWKLQTENTFKALHFVRSLPQKISHCEQFLTLSRVIDLNVSPQLIQTISLTISRMTQRCADQFELIRDGAFQQFNNPLISWKDFSNLVTFLGTTLLKTILTEQRKVLRRTPFNKWIEKITSLQTGTAVQNGESFEDEMESLARSHPSLESGLVSFLIDLRVTDVAIAAMFKEFDAIPNNKQAAIAQYIGAHLGSMRRQMWSIPSGQGKSRMETWLGYLLKKKKGVEEVWFVYNHDHFKERDQLEFAPLFSSIGTGVKFLVGLDELAQELESMKGSNNANGLSMIDTNKRGIAAKKNPNHVIIVDEADDIIFRNPLRFNTLVGSLQCVCFTGSPDNQVDGGLESTIIKLLGFHRFDPYEDKWGNLNMDEEITSADDAEEYCRKKLLCGPVIVYTEDEFFVAGWDIPYVPVDPSTSISLLRSLHTKENGAYQLFVISPFFGSRGVDFRSMVPVTLLILDQFSNYRDAYQCYHRVGRMEDSGKRCGIAGMSLISKEKSSSYIARLQEAIDVLSKSTSLTITATKKKVSSDLRQGTLLRTQKKEQQKLQ